MTLVFVSHEAMCANAEVCNVTPLIAAQLVSSYHTITTSSNVLLSDALLAEEPVQGYERVLRYHCSFIWCFLQNLPVAFFRSKTSSLQVPPSTSIYHG